MIRPGDSAIPGVAAIAFVGAPTGTPSDAAAPLLGADTTGIGTWEGGLGAAIEERVDHLLVNVTGLMALRLPRDVYGVRQALGI